MRSQTKTFLHRVDPRANGLYLLPTNRAAAAKAVVFCILGKALFVVVLDAFIFRHSLSPDYVTLYTSPLIPRTPVLCILAAIEEVKYRLLVMTGLTMLAALWRGKVSGGMFVAIILASQFYGVWPQVLNDPVYGSLRYWAVGCLWGYLYWRHGWLAALIGHATSHLVLDPLLMLALLGIR